MLMQKTMKINNQGHLEINGCDTVDLAASFGTPLMIIDVSPQQTISLIVSEKDQELRAELKEEVKEAIA
jgi:diaminopimelate decarboxylase